MQAASYDRAVFRCQALTREWAARGTGRGESAAALQPPETAPTAPFSSRRAGHCCVQAVAKPLGPASLLLLEDCAMQGSKKGRRMVSTRSGGGVLAPGLQSTEVSSRRRGKPAQSASGTLPKLPCEALCFARPGLCETGYAYVRANCRSLPASNKLASGAGRAGAERSAPAPSTREPGWRARVSSVAEDADPAVLRSHGAAAEAGPGRLAEARTRPAQADPDDAASESGSDSGSDSDSDAGCLPGLAQSMWAALASGRVAPAAARAPAEAAARKPGRRRAVHGDRAAAAAEPGRALPSGAAAAAEAAAAGLAGSGRRAAAEGAGEGQDTVAEIAWVPHTGLPAPSGGSGPAQDAGSELGLAKQVRVWRGVPRASPAAQRRLPLAAPLCSRLLARTPGRRSSRCAAHGGSPGRNARRRRRRPAGACVMCQAPWQARLSEPRRVCLHTHLSVWQGADAGERGARRGWFDLPATQITDEVKRDLRLLHLRAALDPKRFYKGFDQSKFPKYFQLGTVVEGAADFYAGARPLRLQPWPRPALVLCSGGPPLRARVLLTRLDCVLCDALWPINMHCVDRQRARCAGRLPRKQRKRTLTDELLADAELTHVRKKRYGALQEERQRFRRVKRRKTDLPRLKKAHRRPKH